MQNKNWDTTKMPSQKGKNVIITGGNAGLGFQMSLELAKKGANVVIACRSKEKGWNAVERIQKELQNSDAKLDVIPMDLTDFNSIENFAKEYKAKYDTLDILINNAGVVNLIEKGTTASGLEMHMTTNHYGHFALTGRLFPLIKKTKNARVVTMSSGGYRWGVIDFDDLNWDKRPYDRVKSYGDSKLANMIFMRSLQLKFEKENISAISVAAHPGLSATERQQTIGIGGKLTKILAQPVYKGALPALRAATDPEVKGMEFYGPRFGMFGYPKLVKIKPMVFDDAVAERLWKVSEEVTNVKF
ncbi:oxidoreductase [Aureivirga sp. CE67]|uniref:oxidoreductase n=1 Tax=Aureivirga sp. CE67 TaxID=1788983 RepID=UPI0018CA0436|nr:oxidoreductase [Aureivirga sp. CE67]